MLYVVFKGKFRLQIQTKEFCFFENFDSFVQ